MWELCNVMMLSGVSFSRAMSLSDGERVDISRGEYDEYSGRDERVDIRTGI